MDEDGRELHSEETNGFAMSSLNSLALLMSNTVLLVLCCGALIRCALGRDIAEDSRDLVPLTVKSTGVLGVVVPSGFSEIGENSI